MYTSIWMLSCNRCCNRYAIIWHCLPFMEMVSVQKWHSELCTWALKWVGNLNSTKFWIYSKFNYKFRFIIINELWSEPVPFSLPSFPSQFPKLLQSICCQSKHLLLCMSSVYWDKNNTVRMANFFLCYYKLYTVICIYFNQ